MEKYNNGSSSQLSTRSNDLPRPAVGGAPSSTALCDSSGKVRITSTNEIREGQAKKQKRSWSKHSSI